MLPLGQKKPALMSKRLLNICDFSFTGLEEFALECARGNLVVYRYLMENSGLCENKWMYFYRSVVEKALGKNESSLHTLAMLAGKETGEGKSSTPELDDHLKLAGKLYKNIVELKLRCRSQLPLEITDDSLNDAIEHIYQKNCSGAHLWVTTEAQVLARCHAV